VLKVLSCSELGLIRLDRLGDSLYVKESTGKNETKQVEP
jgi:hypothetical protein